MDELIRAVLGALPTIASAAVIGVCGYAFWSSGILTGNQTQFETGKATAEFWSSGILTGNQTKPSLTEQVN